MNEFIKYFILLQLSVQLLCVASYTVLLKQVKTLHPAVRVYRYELTHPRLLPDGSTPYVYHKPLLGQRIYPVVLKHGKDNSFKPRSAPLQKEKAKYYKSGEKTVPRDPPQRMLSHHLVPPVSNQVEENLEMKDQEDEVRPLVVLPNLGKSFSSFGQDKGWVYSNPGKWATPPVQTDAENTTKSEFTPSQLYLQIRHKNTVIHVPQSEALKDAETLEELINAPRLKELARTTHVQETYSEEGYEDTGYDHAGHIRQAQHGEVYDAKDEGRFKIKDPPVIIDYDSDLEESKKIPTRNFSGVQKQSTGENNKLEPRITRSRSEVNKTSVEYAKTPKNYKGEHKYSSRVKSPVEELNGRGNALNSTETREFQNVGTTFPSFFGEVPPIPEGMLSNDSALYYEPPGKKPSKHRNSTKIYPVNKSPSSNDFIQGSGYADFKPYISAIDSQASPSAKSLKYSRIYSKKTKQLRLEPFKNENFYLPPPPPAGIPETLPPQDLQPPSADEKTREEELANHRIVLPTIGYISSLTTAHFGKDNLKPSEEGLKTQLTGALNLTQALDYLRLKKNQKNLATTKTTTEVDLRTFEPMKLKSRPSYHSFITKSKREVFLLKTQGQRSKQEETEEYEGHDESDAPHNEKNEEIAEDERKRIEDENLEKEKYEADLREEITNQEKEILKETYTNIGVKEDISGVFPEFPSFDSEPSLSSPTIDATPTAVDVQKYPFYLSKRLPENSPLRYATDPKQFPRKSGYKMEFYESREGVIQCPDTYPDLKNLPNSDSTEYSEEQAGENRRIAGLGDKIVCLRKKYFDPEPFDNPIFKEKEINYVGKRNWKKVQTNIEAKSPRKPEKAARQRSPSKTVQQKLIFSPKNLIISQETRSNPISILGTFNHHLRTQTNETETPKITPVTETLSDFPPQPTVRSPVSPTGWSTIYHLKSFPLVQPRYSTLKNQPHTRQYLKAPPKHIAIPHICLKNLSNSAVHDGANNLMVYCNNATLFHEVIGNVTRFWIIPKDVKEHKKQVKPSVSSDESDWIPVLGYSTAEHLRKPHRLLSRRTDRVTKLKNETNHNTSSNHYVIDELKEEENVRKGEVMDDMDHYMKLSEESKEEEEETAAEMETKTEILSRERREAQSDPNVQVQEGQTQKPERVSDTDAEKLFELKRPLTRLSGRDFLVRYYKNKGKFSSGKTEDFWKLPNNQKPRSNTAETKKPVTPMPKPTETGINKVKLKEVSDSQPTISFSEKSSKYKIKQMEPRKISALNIIPEKIKHPEVDVSPDFWKATAPSLGNPSKIITKVSREMSQSTDRPRIVRKHKELILTPKADNIEIETSSARPRVPENKAVNENSLSKKSKESNRSTDMSEGPILYYVVNLNTGRGRWITNYVERRRRAFVKYQKGQKPKENFKAKKGRNKE